MNRESRHPRWLWSALLLLLLVPGAARAQASFQIGFAKENVDWGSKLTMGGYGVYFGLPSATRQNGEGLHDSLYASAVAIRGTGPSTLVIVALDSVGMGSASIARIRSKVASQLPGQPVKLIVTASHSHQAPDTMGIWGALPFFTGRNGSYMKHIEQQTANAVVKAIQSAVPAYLSYAITSKPNSSTTKATAPERKDDAVTVVVARTPAGQLLGTLTQWSAHPTILGANNNTLSSDFVGTFRYFMEQQYGGVHVYVNGAMADEYVAGGDGLWTDPFPLGKRDPQVTDGYERVAAVGRDLFVRVSQVLPAAQPLTSNAVGHSEASFPITNTNLLFQQVSDWNIIEKDISNNKAQTEMSWFRIGGLQGFTVPGEMSAAGTRLLRAELVSRGAEATLVIGMADDWLGYMMMPDEYDTDRYSYNRTLSPDRSAGQTIVNQAKALPVR